MIAFLFSPAGKVAAALVIIAGLLSVGYVKGKSDARVEVLKDTVEALEKRNGIDDAVQNLTSYELCLALGGLSDECSELRGVESSPASQ